MKLYAAMVLGLALGATLALVIAARDIEDADPGTPGPMPANRPTRPGAGNTMGA